MAEEERADGQLPAWVVSWASVITPASILSALLFYFGYASSRVKYEYFGIDVDTVGLGTQDYIMRSPEPLLTPLLVFTLLGAGLLTAHVAVRRRIAVSVDAGDRSAARVRTAARVTLFTGLALIGAGVVLLLVYSVVRDWAAYTLVTPLLFTTGAGLTVYAWRVRDLLDGALTRRAPATPPGEPPPAADVAAFPRRTVTVLLYVLFAVGVFWATATVAQWSGRGLAEDQARHLDRLPRVILDTRERLYLRSPGVEETVLPPSEGQTFRYRYRRLRLLIVGGDRMFLVPETWSASNSTLVVPIGEGARVQFQFQNHPP
ncbi:hypothetical protein [Sphaerisporangium sp. TRM90804]|uniref:hypothetical protein n=1 Tax=Sphaerisporangium sp. TRM90804 TaxID=3031113 RepID=UPI00244B6307|nr:hypothetical protein [Sphaerisporangium sp. TRM90804]MDH2429252.1 hypothetical protein [Sphaerisporangium sp. TRM90804]